MTGYGVPKLTGSTVSGNQDTALAGLNTRFADPLLVNSPTFEVSPELLRQTVPYLVGVRETISSTNGVICHSDLHERQLIVSNRNLAALIDFGDATICDYRWDFGSLLYFHGLSVLEKVVGAYNPNNQNQLITDAHLFSLGIAMHHAARSVLPEKSHRLKVATVHLQRTLLYLDKRLGH
ncbi:MAG: phosphotransferase family protein [Alphaproteobacteria bacterium]